MKLRKVETAGSLKQEEGEKMEGAEEKLCHSVPVVAGLSLALGRSGERMLLLQPTVQLSDYGLPLSGEILSTV